MLMSNGRVNPGVSFRKITLAFLAATALWIAPAQVGLSAQPSSSSPVRVAIIGESNLRTDFIESLRGAARDEHLDLETVPRSDPNLTFTIVIAQETTVGSAAAAAIALEPSGDIAASVVRSGRLSGRGALNACAKELAKKIKVLVP